MALGARLKAQLPHDASLIALPVDQAGLPIRRQVVAHRHARIRQPLHSLPNNRWVIGPGKVRLHAPPAATVEDEARGKSSCGSEYAASGGRKARQACSDTKYGRPDDNPARQRRPAKCVQASCTEQAPSPQMTLPGPRP